MGCLLLVMVLLALKSQCSCCLVLLTPKRFARFLSQPARYRGTTISIFLRKKPMWIAVLQLSQMTSTSFTIKTFNCMNEWQNSHFNLVSWDSTLAWGNSEILMGGPLGLKPATPNTLSWYPCQKKNGDTYYQCSRLCCSTGPFWRTSANCAHFLNVYCFKPWSSKKWKDIGKRNCFILEHCCTNAF